MRGSFRLTASCVAVALLWSATLAGQSDVQWQVDGQDWQGSAEPNVRPDDREAILALARQVGIAAPARVSFETSLPGVCRFLLVASAVKEANNRISWQEVPVYRTDWSECSHKPEIGDAILRRGRWTANAADLTEREEWRIRDGHWHVDVVLDAGVAYDDAQRIVLAVRRHTLVSRLPSSMGPLKRDTRVPAIDAQDIEAIARVRAESNTFEVRLDARAGLLLTVKVVGDIVELHAVGTYMVRTYGSRPPSVRTVSRRYPLAVRRSVAV